MRQASSPSADRAGERCSVGSAGTDVAQCVWLCEIGFQRVSRRRNGRIVSCKLNTAEHIEVAIISMCTGKNKLNTLCTSSVLCVHRPRCPLLVPAPSLSHASSLFSSPPLSRLSCSYIGWTNALASLTLRQGEPMLCSRRCHHPGTDFLRMHGGDRTPPYSPPPTAQCQEHRLCLECARALLSSPSC